MGSYPCQEPRARRLSVHVSTRSHMNTHSCTCAHPRSHVCIHILSALALQAQGGTPSLFSLHQLLSCCTKGLDAGDGGLGPQARGTLSTATSPRAGRAAHSPEQVCP